MDKKCLFFHLPLVGRSNVAAGKVRVGVLLSSFIINTLRHVLPPPEADYIAFDLPKRATAFTHL